MESVRTAQPLQSSMEFFNCSTTEEFEKLAREWEAGCRTGETSDEKNPRQRDLNPVPHPVPTEIGPSRQDEEQPDEQALTQHDQTLPTRPMIISRGPGNRHDEEELDEDEYSDDSDDFYDLRGLKLSDVQAVKQLVNALVNRADSAESGSTSLQDGDMVEGQYLTPRNIAFANRPGLIEREFTGPRSRPMLGQSPQQSRPSTSQPLQSCLAKKPRYGRSEDMIDNMEGSWENANGRRADANFRSSLTAPNSEDEIDVGYHADDEYSHGVKHVRFVLPGPVDPPEPFHREFNESDSEEEVEYFEQEDDDEDAGEHFEHVEHVGGELTPSPLRPRPLRRMPSGLPRPSAPGPSPSSVGEEVSLIVGEMEELMDRYDTSSPSDEEVSCLEMRRVRRG
jgi:hypothetical protein